jgi:hypothetical protein
MKDFCPACRPVRPDEKRGLLDAPEKVRFHFSEMQTNNVEQSHDQPPLLSGRAREALISKQGWGFDEDGTS